MFLERLSLRTKLLTNLCISIIVTVIFIIFTFVQFLNLQNQQNIGYSTATDAMNAQDAANLGWRMYNVIADATINRNFSESAKSWNDIKESSLHPLQKS